MRSSDWIWLAAMLAALISVYQLSKGLVKAVLAVNKWITSIENNTAAQGQLKKWLEKFKDETNEKFADIGDRLEVVEGIVLVPSAEKAG